MPEMLFTVQLKALAKQLTAGSATVTVTSRKAATYNDSV